MPSAWPPLKGPTALRGIQVATNIWKGEKYAEYQKEEQETPKKLVPHKIGRKV